ncbi:UNVERIFIED_CONTAM: hypothetical protein K2H54_042714 [Gekko kuhli]
MLSQLGTQPATPVPSPTVEPVKPSGSLPTAPKPSFPHGPHQSGPPLNNTKDPPGIHLSHKVREWILDGDYMETFTLLKPEADNCKLGLLSEKKGNKKDAVNSTILNWLTGYNVFMGVVQSAYPEHGWHLSNHLANVLRAAAISYDAVFHKQASQSDLAI